MTIRKFNQGECENVLLFRRGSIFSYKMHSRWRALWRAVLFVPASICAHGSVDPSVAHKVNNEREGSQRRHDVASHQVLVQCAWWAHHETDLARQNGQEEMYWYRIRHPLLDPQDGVSCAAELAASTGSARRQARVRVSAVRRERPIRQSFTFRGDCAGARS